MASPKYRRKPKVREIFNPPENDEWIDSKLLSETTEAFREIELAIQEDLDNDSMRRMRMARHYPLKTRRNPSIIEIRRTAYTG